MTFSKFILYLVTTLVFLSILVLFPEVHVAKNINLDGQGISSKVFNTLNNVGLIDKAKIYSVDNSDGTSYKIYPIDRVLRTPFTNTNFKLGLDLQGGTYVALKADMSQVADSDKITSLNAAKKIIENRVNQFGINETNVYTSTGSGDYKIIVELPGNGQDVEDKISLLKQSASLEFLKLNAEGTNWELTGITGKDLQTANATPAQSGGAASDGTQNYWIQLQFTAEGAQKFTNLAAENLGKQIAISFDNQILSAPVINTDILKNGGVISNPQIQGTMTKDEASQIASFIRAGALPVPLTLAEQRQVDPTLGQSALDKVFVAGLVGIASLIVFMVVLYRKYGLVAAVALILYTLFNLAIIKFFGVTLTLAGIAGFILSVGMAVDANVLIFERMKEEFKRGASKSTALRLGFERAWSSICDSNTSSLLTCMILFLFGTTLTKSFAFNLAIGVAVSLFTAVVITRQLVKKVH